MKFLFFFFLIQITSSFADTIDINGIRWPIPAWNISGETQTRMSTPTCQEFKKFAIQSKKFLTDGLVVIKDGLLQFEYYDPHYSPNTPHTLWSISKTITATLLGIAVKDGKVSLDDYLHQYFPRPDFEENYQKIKLQNLLYLDTGYIWNEYYAGDIEQSPVLSMLYGAAHRNMVDFALTRKIIPEGPGYQFNYSTGAPVLTMGVLKIAYGQDYDQMPWKNLFNPLGMGNVRFERDHKGVFNGGSSAFATPREMAKLGYLYLNHGIWNGKEILSEDWIKKMSTVSPGYLSPGTVIKDITDDGVYGGSIWLNRAVKPNFGKPYPASPDDALVALGHYGQFLVVLPSQDMVIARTGHDEEYNSKIDVFISKAIGCFHDPSYPEGKIIPPPASSKTTIGQMFKTLKTGLQSNVIQAAVSKSVCSCHFISGIDLKTCIERSNIPAAKLLTRVSKIANSISVEQTALAKFLVKVLSFRSEPIAISTYDQLHPEFGCHLK